MAWPEIDYLELPNGLTATVCGPHKKVVCGRCCLDFSTDLELAYDEEFGPESYSSEDEDLFGFDFNSPVPRDVTFSQIADSKYGRTQAVYENHGAEMTNETMLSGDEEEPTIPPSDSALAPVRTKVSGTYFPVEFQHPRKASMRPQDLFPPGISRGASPHAERFINRYNSTQFLIYTDGACLDNGATDARGGCAFVFQPNHSEQNGSCGFRLEDHGADEKAHRHTSNRAELRAVIAALRFRFWPGEGFKSLVIATDSTYVANGATDWIRGWLKKGWKLSSGQSVKNRDLWEALLLDIEKLHDRGFDVCFWKIPREWNIEADRAAKVAAAIPKRTDKFADIMGVLV